MDTNRGEHNLLILIINNIVQQKQYVGNIWIDILSNIFLLNITVVLPFKTGLFLFVKVGLWVCEAMYSLWSHLMWSDIASLWSYSKWSHNASLWSHSTKDHYSAKVILNTSCLATNLASPSPSHNFLLLGLNMEGECCERFLGGALTLNTLKGGTGVSGGQDPLSTPSRHSLDP